MKFADFVPCVIKVFATEMMKGEDGWLADRQKLSKRLNRIESELALANKQGNKVAIDNLVREKSELSNELKFLDKDIACLRRLVEYPRMQSVYAALDSEFAGNSEKISKLRSFIHSAWSAYIDYEFYRDRMSGKEIKKRVKQVGDAAKKLALLLRGVEKDCEQLPEDFQLVRQLLWKTDNSDIDGRDLTSWRVMRHHILGSHGSGPSIAPSSDAIEPPFNLELEVHVGVLESDLSDFRSSSLDTTYVQTLTESSAAISDASPSLDYVWELAPPVYALLETLAHAAEEFEPQHPSGAIGGALLGRQKGKRSDYVRGFIHQLELILPPYRGHLTYDGSQRCLNETERKARTA